MRHDREIADMRKVCHGWDMMRIPVPVNRDVAAVAAQP